MKYVLLAGRILFSFIFFSASFGHFKSDVIGYAASQGVPLSSVLVPFTGVLCLLGSLSIALGFKSRIGAWLLVVFLVPATFMMHKFWTVSDPMMHQMQMIMFMKNISMLGGALMVAYFGSGELSLDNLKKKES